MMKGMRIFASLFGVMYLSSCFSDSNDQINPTAHEYLSIESVAPAPDSVVFADAKVSVAFSHDIDMGTVNSFTVYLLDENDFFVKGKFSYLSDMKTVMFVPDGGFVWGKKYRVYVTTGIYNTGGLHMKEEYRWSFKIAPFYDTQAPRIDELSLNPVGEAVDPAAIISFRIIDNSDIDIESINGTSIVIKRGDEQIVCDYRYFSANKEIQGIPRAELTEGQQYTVSLNRNLRDTAGNPIENPLEWKFTVRAIPPQVISVSPPDGAENVATGADIRIQFSESMDPQSVKNGIFLKDSAGNDISCLIEYDGEKFEANLVPDHLEYYTSYEVIVTTDVKDASEIPLGEEFRSRFFTMQEDISPEVYILTEGPLEVDEHIELAFSEQMDENSFAGNIILKDVFGNTVPLYIDYNPLTCHAVLHPLNKLVGYYEYTLYISTGVKDIHGNPLAGNYEKQYRTNPSATDTLLVVYAPVDYPGGEYIDDDIAEIIRAGVDPENLRILCFADYQYNGNTKLFESIYKNKRDIPLLEAGFAGNEVNSAQGDTISTLLKFADDAYWPSRKVFVLIDRKARPLWCAGYDQTSGASLRLHDFSDAIKGRNISVMVFDGPLKSTIEGAWELRKEKTGTEYFIASQGELLRGGFDYRTLCEKVDNVIHNNQQPQNISLEIAKAIADEESYPYAMTPEEPVDRRSLALIDLGKFENAIAAYMDDITGYCSRLYENNPEVLDAARFAAHFYYPIPWYADMIEFLQAINDPELADAIDAFSSSVLKKVMPMGEVHSGLAIIFSTKTHESWYLNNTYGMDFLGKYQWDEFLKGKHFGTHKDVFEPFNDYEGQFCALQIDGSMDEHEETIENYIHDPYDVDSFAIGINYPFGVYRLNENVLQVNKDNKKWMGAFQSSDGGMIASAAVNDNIYISTDGGMNWAARAEKKNWVAITGSSDGSKLAAAVFGEYLYTSSYPGNTWNPCCTDKKRNWKGIASSAGGVMLAAVESGGFVHCSFDGGTNWEQRLTDNPRDWRAVAVSSDGNTIVACAYNDKIYFSSNGGTLWEAIYLPGQWSSVACSGNGKKIIAAESNGYLHFSNDGGENWKTLLSDAKRPWRGITIDKGGTKLAGADGEFIWESSDEGRSWKVRCSEGFNNWSSVNYSWGTDLLVTANEAKNSLVQGTVTVDITGIPENCEVLARIKNKSGEILAESKKDLYGAVSFEFDIEESANTLYFLQLIPVNIYGWSMNTKSPYMVTIKYKKAE